MGNTEKFNMIAGQYDTPDRMKAAEIISDTVRRYVTNAKDKTAVDFGCGTGLVGIGLLDVFSSILFVDSAPNMVEEVKRKIQKLQVQNADVLCCDFETDFFPELQADYIIAAQVLLHIEDTELILSRLYNVLNKGGHLLIIDFDKNEEIISKEVHNGFDQGRLSDTAKKVGFVKTEAETFYYGKGIFMNKDASLFILDCEK